MTDTTRRYRRGSAAAEVTDILRRRILTLDLRPGAPLDETRLAQELDVSRSPVRDALARLGAERLVVSSANRGAMVAPIDIGAFPQFIEALDVQQRLATRLAARHRSSADVLRLRELAESYNRSAREVAAMDVLQANYEFHFAVAEAGRNTYVTRQYGELLSEARRLLHIHIEYLVRTEGHRILKDQHFDFVDAIEARDVEEADRVAHAHTLQFHDRFLAAMRYMPDDGFAIEAGEAR